MQQELTWFWSCLDMGIEINQLGLDKKVDDAIKVAPLFINRWKSLEGRQIQGRITLIQKYQRYFFSLLQRREEPGFTRSFRPFLVWTKSYLGRC